MSRDLRILPVCPFLILVGLGCASAGRPSGTSAVAELQDASGSTVGTAELRETEGGVRIVVEVRDLAAGNKGVHIHETGSCEPPEFKSAGDHFNPAGQQHGTLNPAGPHAGDLPNLTVQEDGAGRLETTNDRVRLGPGASSVLDADGSALVVHAAPDDLKTDPAGNSGDRIACGVIERGPAPSEERRPAGY